MFLPRRQYRCLLLPPGWLALGFLLLLGCQALLTHERQLHLSNVMQLTMPPLKPEKSNSCLIETSVYESVTNLNVLRPWHNADFTGNPIR